MSDDHKKPWLPSTKVQEKIQDVLFQIQLCEAGRQYIASCLANGPARKVGSQGGNSLARFTSLSTGVQLMLESRSGEYPLAVLADADPQTVYFLAQPLSVTCDIKDAAGTIKTKSQYTADLLCIRKDEVTVLEARDLSRLTEMHVKNPYQFYIDEAGNWHYRAAEEAFIKMGMKHIVVANTSIPHVVVRNIRFLESYVNESCPPLDPVVAIRLKSFVGDRRFIGLRDLLEQGSFAADDVFKAITERVVHVDLREDLLDSTDDLIIFSDAETRAAHKAVSISTMAPPLPIPGTMHLRTGSLIKFSGRDFRVLLVGERDVSVRDAQGAISTLPLSAIIALHARGEMKGDGVIADLNLRRLCDVSPEALARATERLSATENPDASDFSRSTINRYRGLIEGAPNRIEALLALVSNEEARGNRTSRASEKNRDFGRKVIEDFHNTPTAPNAKATYKVYADRCSEMKELSGQPMHPVSYKTFLNWIDVDKSVKERNGKRADYQASRIVTSLDNSYPVHGVRPHEVLYLDHTVLNLATMSPDGVQLGKPTLTLGTDGNTTQARVLLLTYVAPSATLVLLAIRDYIRRWNRVPRMISVDNGSDFISKELAWICKLLKIDIRYRPPGQPRGGAAIERAIGVTEEELIAQMDGNTRQLKDPRLVTKSVDPFRRTTWTLAASYGALQEFLFEVRANRPHPRLGMSPNEFEAQRLVETGTREHEVYAFNEDIMLLTCPSSSRRYHSVDHRRGVYTGGWYYNHIALKDVKKNEKVEIRVEPWMHRVIYVRVRGRWVAATASNSRLLSNRSRFEVEPAYREEKRLSLLNANRARTSINDAKKMAGLWSDPGRFDPRIAKQQAEMEYLYKPIGMTVAAPRLIEAEGVPLGTKGEVADESNDVPPSSSPSHANDAPAPLENATNQTPTSDLLCLPLPKDFENAPGYF